MDVFLNNRLLFRLQEANTECLNKQIKTRLNLSPDEYYLLSNGKKLSNELSPSHNGSVHIILRLAGGKGGFGSMLRAIGAQIEKTTNREACRDLSGRRLRDINEEQRLKNWIATQAEREKEAALRKKKKLEKLCEEPKFEFKDETYEMERSLLPEIVEDAVLKGFQASSSSSNSGNGSNGDTVKRKSAEPSAKSIPKKKKKLWIDDEISSDEDVCSDDEEDANNDQEKDHKKISEKQEEKDETINQEKNDKKINEKLEGKEETCPEVPKSEDFPKDNTPKPVEEIAKEPKEESSCSSTISENSTTEHRSSGDSNDKTDMK